MSTKNQIQKFCKIFYEELEKDNWGDIDPELFYNIATRYEEIKIEKWDFDFYNDCVNLEKVLIKTFEKMKQ